MIFPEIVDMAMPVEGVFHNLCLLSIKKEHPGQAKKVIHGLWGSGQMAQTKTLVVFDEDVDVQDVSQAAWRAFANVDVKRDLVVADGPVDVLDHAAAHFAFGGKIGVDATRKWREEGGREWPEVCVHPPEVVARMDALYERLVPGAPTPRRPRIAPPPAASWKPPQRRDPPVTHPRSPARARAPAPVRAMFDRIAPSYDLLNRVMTLRVDQAWRRRLLLGRSRPRDGESMLDLCAGTMDVAALRAPARTRACGSSGADFSFQMLSRGVEKTGLPATPGRRARPPLPRRVLRPRHRDLRDAEPRLATRPGSPSSRACSAPAAGSACSSSSGRSRPARASCTARTTGSRCR